MQRGGITLNRPVERRARPHLGQKRATLSTFSTSLCGARVDLSVAQRLNGRPKRVRAGMTVIERHAKRAAP
jgi:hypothetical protein